MLIILYSSCKLVRIQIAAGFWEIRSTDFFSCSSICQKKEAGVLGLGSENQGRDWGEFHREKERGLSNTQAMGGRHEEIMVNPCASLADGIQEHVLRHPTLTIPLLQSVKVTASCWIIWGAAPAFRGNPEQRGVATQRRTKQQSGPKILPQNPLSQRNKVRPLTLLGLGGMALAITSAREREGWPSGLENLETMQFSQMNTTCSLLSEDSPSWALTKEENSNSFRQVGKYEQRQESGNSQSMQGCCCCCFILFSLEEEKGFLCSKKYT